MLQSIVWNQTGINEKLEAFESLNHYSACIVINIYNKQKPILKPSIREIP